MDYHLLAKKAIEAKRNALPTYSHFHVGAALLTLEEKVYSGVNVETSSYGLTMCAERTAIFKAISEGERNFKAIAIASDLPGFCPPCGACRQVIWDLCADIDVIMVNHKNELLVKKISELLPFAFGDDKLNEL
ncbi:MAG: cytidine deaminase [Ignavibacteriales bacterium]|nr:cytidine deaminase [Ignavibacteriales bacterium]